MELGYDDIPMVALVASAIVADANVSADPCPAFVHARIGRHQGRIVHSREGACIVEFPTVGDAVACASKVQRALTRRIDGQPEHQRLKLGINLCHVPPGDTAKARRGLDYARHLCDMAEPGGLCLSAVIGDRLTSRRSLAEILADEVRPNRAAAALQWAALIGYFGLWMGLIAWRAIHFALYDTWPCWMPVESLCN
jgi:hypothetical protein